MRAVSAPRRRSAQGALLAFALGSPFHRARARACAPAPARRFAGTGAGSLNAWAPEGLGPFFSYANAAAGHTRTHTRTHARTHAETHTHTHARTRARTCGSRAAHRPRMAKPSRWLRTCCATKESPSLKPKARRPAAPARAASARAGDSPPAAGFHGRLGLVLVWFGLPRRRAALLGPGRVLEYHEHCASTM